MVPLIFESLELGYVFPYLRSIRSINLWTEIIFWRNSETIHTYYWPLTILNLVLHLYQTLLQFSMHPPTLQRCHPPPHLLYSPGHLLNLLLQPVGQPLNIVGTSKWISYLGRPRFIPDNLLCSHGHTHSFLCWRCPRFIVRRSLQSHATAEYCRKAAQRAPSNVD